MNFKYLLRAGVRPRQCLVHECSVAKWKHMDKGKTEKVRSGRGAATARGEEVMGSHPGVARWLSGILRFLLESRPTHGHQSQ